MSVDAAQKQAIEHNQGPMLVLAGPGSGKDPCHYPENPMADSKSRGGSG